MDKLPPTAKLVLTYMVLQHLLKGRGHVTIKELNQELQVSQRRLRSVLADLRRRGLIRVYLDPTVGKAHLYSLSFENFDLDIPPVRAGIYYIDIPHEAKIPHDLTFRSYAVIRASDILLHTAAFERKKRLFYLTRCVCTIKPYTPETLEEARQAAKRGKVVAVVYNSQIDKIEIPKDATTLEQIRVAISYIPATV